MSFWGKLGGAFKAIGKGALKVAPIASAFIPGVGPLAAMGIGAATNAISKKASGGSWGDALKSGAIGGAMGAGGAALKGGFLGKLGSKLGIGGNGVQAGIKGVENKILGPSTGQKLLQGFSNAMRSRGQQRGWQGGQQQNWMSPYMRGAQQPRSPYGIGPSYGGGGMVRKMPTGKGQQFVDPASYGGQRANIPGIMY